MKIIIGLIIGYVIATIVAGKKEGDKKSQSVRFSVGDHYLHLHHWILGLLFILVFGPLVLRFNSMLLLGFAIGVIIQGLRYHDYLVLWYKKTDEEKIYAKYKKQESQKESEKNK